MKRKSQSSNEGSSRRVVPNKQATGTSNGKINKNNSMKKSKIVQVPVSESVQLNTTSTELLSDGDHENDDGNVEIEGDDGEAIVEGSKDGLAEMMSKILNQQIQEGDDPVLAKRKTNLMKGSQVLNLLVHSRYITYNLFALEMEKEKEDKNRLKGLRIERKQHREKQLCLPDVCTADFERQLRKLATKGGTGTK